MGRAPCCDKANVKKGPWSPEEDAKLKAYIEQQGTGGNWIALPQKIGLKRCGKSCRLRWLNYLRPNIKHGGFSEEEDNVICSLYINIGSRWSIIAAQLPGRTDNDIKNYWNTRLKKKLLGKQRKEQAARRASLKQEMLMKRPETADQSSYMASPPVIMNYQSPFNWPGMAPLNVPPHDQLVSQDANFMSSQESLRNLLVKIGGRFSDDHHHLQDPNMSAAGNYTVDLGGLQSGADSITMFSSSSASSMNSMESSCTTTVNGVAGAQGMFQGLLLEENLLPVELEAMAAAAYSDPQGSQGFGSLLYGSMDMSSHVMSTSTTTGSSGLSSVESSSWENSLANYPHHHQLVSEYETSNCLQSSIRQDSSPFEDSRLLYFVNQ